MWHTPGILLEGHPTHSSWFRKNKPDSNRVLKLLLVPSRLHTTSAACPMKTIGDEPAPAVFQPRRHRIFLNTRCPLLSAPLYWAELGPKYLAFWALFSISATGKRVEHFKAWVNLVPTVSLLLGVLRRETLGAGLAKGPLCKSFHAVVKFSAQ